MQPEENVLGSVLFLTGGVHTVIYFPSVPQNLKRIFHCDSQFVIVVKSVRLVSGESEFKSYSLVEACWVTLGQSCSLSLDYLTGLLSI